MPLANGATLGPYTILEPLGAGAMGEVYRARDTKLDRDIALKVLPVTAVADPVARARLVREAKLAASLNHPYICTVHDVGDAGRLMYVAMEWVNGRPLSTVIPDGGLESDRVLSYGVQIAEALAQAHGHGIVHRDLKGANVLVTADGRIKVLDFGLAVRRVLDGSEATQSAASLDLPGVVAGTLPYMSPEALRGEAANPRSDVWSLGVLLYEMASGRRPFRGASAADLTSSVLRDVMSPLPEHVVPGLVGVIERCLEKSPQRRYGNGGELSAALVAVQKATQPITGPRAAPGRRNTIVALVGIAAAAALVAVIASVEWWPRAAPSQGESGGIRALAVLPLENLSGDTAQEYFADGLTDELITRLSKVSGLSVTSRTAVMQFKKTQKPVSEIAQQLGVQAVVEGSVTRSGDHVRITARLIDAGSGRSLWTDRYDRAASDVLAIQGDVASAIGQAIRTNLTPQERARLSSRPASDSRAYEFYLRGRFHAGREGPEDIRQAITFFEQAVSADPQFAPAHAELARAYGQHLFYVTPGDLALQERAFVEVESALAIDPELDTAHLARGLLLWQAWNHFPHDRAIASYRRAIELNPNSDEAHHQLGFVYSHIGMFDAAGREIREALRLNPSNTLAQFREGVLALYAGQYALALEIFNRTPAAFQPFQRAFQRADALFHLGRKAEALASAEEYLSTHPEDLGGVNTALQALIAADAGDTARTIALADAAREKGKGYGHFHHTAFTIGRAYALLGRADDAVKWLQQAADDGYPCYPVFLGDTTLDRIRGERVFQRFLAAQHEIWQRFKKLVE